MASFPPHITEALLEEAREATVKTGEVFYRGAQHLETAILALIAEGLVRTFVQAENGRRVTIRYAGRRTEDTASTARRCGTRSS
jgi:hypothetical protein